MKTFWIDRRGIAVYDTDISHRIFAHIFLYWAIESILLVGDIEISRHSDLRRKNFAPKTPPSGAGVIENEKIVSWESAELGIITPEKFKQTIIEALSFK